MWSALSISPQKKFWKILKIIEENIILWKFIKNFDVTSSYLKLLSEWQYLNFQLSYFDIFILLDDCKTVFKIFLINTSMNSSYCNISIKTEKVDFDYAFSIFIKFIDEIHKIFSLNTRKSDFANFQVILFMISFYSAHVLFTFHLGA